MQNRKRVAVLHIVITLFLLVGCQTQTIESKDGSSVEKSAQRQSITVFGVSPELHQEAVTEGEKAKEKLEELEKDRSLSRTAKRILAEAEEALEHGDNKRYLAKIQEYRKLLNDEPIKRAAESWVLEGRVLFSQLKLKEAQKAIEKSVKLDASNSENLLLLAEYMRWNGDYKEMLKVSLKAISIIKDRELLDEILLAEGYSSLGLAYLFSGDYSSAVNPLQNSLGIKKKLLGEEHPYVAVSMGNLARLYELQGKYEKAEPLSVKTLEMYKNKLGEEHPYVAVSMGNLAGLYESQGKYKKAEPLSVKALEINKKLLGEEHPYVAVSMGNLRGIALSES